MEKEFAEELGKIENVFLGKEGHGILTFNITLNFGGMGQGFGGYRLDTYNKETKKNEGSAAGTDLILRLLELFDTDELQKLVGRNVFALRAEKGIHPPIIGLKTPAFEGGRTFLIQDWQDRWFPKENNK